MAAFALLLPVVAASVGVAVDYQRASSYREKLSMAADQALLAATTASGRGASIEAALILAQQQWNANLAQMPGATASAKFKVDNTGGKATASVTYSGQVTTTFTRLMGITSVAVSGTAATQAKVTTIQPTKYSGSGSSWGDPHLDGADGYRAEFMCPQPYWYNLLSDGGVEVNVSCFHLVAGPYVGADVMSDETVLLGSHVISVHQGPPDNNFTWPASRTWLGEVTIDGVVYEPSQGTTILGTWREGTVTASIGDGGDPADQDSDTITVSTPQYSIQLGFAHNNGGLVTFAATNAGVCGVPGGLWGQTLGGVDDRTASNARSGAIDASAFAVDNATTTTPEFNRAPCSTSVVSDLRLTR